MILSFFVVQGILEKLMLFDVTWKFEKSMDYARAALYLTMSDIVHERQIYYLKNCRYYVTKVIF